MPPKPLPSKGSKIMSKQLKSGTSKTGASADKKTNKRKRMFLSEIFIKICILLLNR